MNMPEKTLLISIVIPTMNRVDLLRACIESARREARPFAHEIIVVYGPSSDGTREYLAEQNDVTAIPEGPRRGAAAAFDKGFRSARGAFVTWLNDDCSYQERALTNMVAFMHDHPEVGMGAFYFNGNDFDKPFDELRIEHVYGIPYANFGCIRRPVLEQVQFLDPQFVKYGFDPDLSMKVWDAGFTVRGCADAVVWHHCPEDAVKSAGRALVEDDSRYLFKKWEARERALFERVDHQWPDVQSYWRTLALDEKKAFLKKYITGYCESGGIEKARACVEELEMLDRNDPETQYMRAYVLRKTGEATQATEAFAAVLSTLRDDSALAGRCCFHLGELWYEANDMQKAAGYLRRCCAINPGHVRATALLARAADQAVV